jgi:toxin ParE1/3/4
MLRILRSAQSDEDLITIWQYIATVGQNPDAADRLLREIDRRIQLLARHPLMGEAQPQFGERTRRTIVGNYLVFYDVLDDVIHVLRVYHSARRLEDLRD